MICSQVSPGERGGWGWDSGGNHHGRRCQSNYHLLHRWRQRGRWVGRNHSCCWFQLSWSWRNASPHVAWGMRTDLRLKLLHPPRVSRRVHFKWDDGSGFHSQRPGLREQLQLCSKGGGRLHRSGVIQPPSSLQEWVKSIQLYWCNTFIHLWREAREVSVHNRRDMRHFWYQRPRTEQHRLSCILFVCLC